ncbi:MAG: hypothetical protein HDT07_01740 [Bacteroidales bacterium]|nr:hypothetical protein [Bacteroidales bacterium]
MINFEEQLEKYLSETPRDILEREWSDIESLNEIGPDVLEYAERVKECFGILVPTNQLTFKQAEPFNTNEQYYLAS